MFPRIMLLFCVIALTGGCESMTNKKICWQLEQNSKSYNHMIRWNEMDKAAVALPPENLRDEFREKVRASKGVKITDVRVKSQECSPRKGEATVLIDIEYYREPSVTVKTIEDLQKWRYVEEEKDERVWRLMTLPPDFK